MAPEFPRIVWDDLENVFATLSAKGSALDKFWNRARQTIATGEAGIGGDKIAEAFRGRYGPARDTTNREADALPEAFMDLVTSGRTAAARAQEIDEYHAKRMRSPR